MHIRPATLSDMTAIYLMGFDEWGEGQSVETYLTECQNSPKYAKGTWYVLEINGEVFSSLIVYEQHFNLSEGLVGIGSVATSLPNRRMGYATRLIKHVVKALTVADITAGFFLYSDVAPEIYEKMGFMRLPESSQRYKTSVAMFRPAGQSLSALLAAGLVIPSYF